MSDGQQRKLDFGRTATWIVLFIVAGVTLGILFTSNRRRSNRSEPVPVMAERPSWQEILRAPICAVPVIAITLAGLGFTVVQGYYSVQHLEAQRRIQAAEAAEREEAVRLQTVQTKRRLRELNDLTVNLTTGEEVARLMPGPDGERFLVRPGLATKPVSRIDPDEVRTESDQVRAAAMLANAVRYGSGRVNRPAGGGQSSFSLEMAALAMLNGGGGVERRLPSSIHILKEDEVQMLEDKRSD